MRWIPILLLSFLTAHAQFGIGNPFYVSAFLKPAAAGGGGSCSGTSWVTGQTLGTPSTGAFGVGARFTIGASPVTVTCLGRWVISGNSQTHVIRIRNNAGTDLGSVTVDCSGATPGEYVYAALSPPVVLAASTQYWIYSDEGAGDQWYFGGTTASVTAVATLTGSAYWDGANNAVTNGENYGPVSFKY